MIKRLLLTVSSFIFPSGASAYVVVIGDGDGIARLLMKIGIDRTTAFQISNFLESYWWVFVLIAIGVYLFDQHGGKKKE